MPETLIFVPFASKTSLKGNKLNGVKNFDSLGRFVWMNNLFFGFNRQGKIAVD